MSELDPEEPLPPPRKAVFGKHMTGGGSFSSWLRLWAHDTFSREQLISSFKTLLWVAPLTLLIWVYAEREQLVPVKDQTIPISVHSSNPNLIVTLLSNDKSVTAQLEGPSVSIEKVTETLQEYAKSDQGVEIEIGNSERYQKGGQFDVSITNLGDAHLFKDNSVTVSNVNPQSLHIEIDQKDTRDAVVDLRPGAVIDLPSGAVPIALAGAPTFEPRTISLTGPKSVLDAAAARNNGVLHVLADIQSYRELTAPGKHALTSVPIQLPPELQNKGVAAAAATVNATVEIRQADATYSTGAITIWATYQPGVANKYHAEYDTSLASGITILGPSEEIEKMQQRGFEPQPKARFEVSMNDARTGGSHTAKLQYDLPFPDLHVSAADQNRTIDYKVVENAPD